MRGKIDVEAVINSQGGVETIRIVHGLLGGQNETTIATVRSWRFHPALKDDKPVIGHRPTGEGKAGTRIGRLEPDRGFIGSVLGGRTRGILPLAAEAIHKVLSSSPLIRGMRWDFQRDFDTGCEERGTLSPQTPCR